MTAPAQAPHTAATDRSFTWRRRHRVAPLTLVLATCLHALPALRLPVATLDEIILLDYPDAVGRGLTPNADFYTVYARLGFDFLGSWYRLFGYTSTSERMAGALYQIALVLGVWALTRRFGDRVAVASGLLAVVLLANDLTAFAWLGALALVIWSLVLVRADSSRLAWVVAGALAGLSVGFRYEMAVVAGLPLLPFLLRHRRAPFVVVGGLAGFLPTGLHLLAVGRDAWDNVSGRAGVNFQIDPDAVPAHIYLGLVVGAAGLTLLVVRALLRRTPEDWSWALLCLCVVPQAVQRVDAYHFAFAAVVVYPLAFAAGMDLSRRTSERRRGLVARAVQVAFMSVPILFLLGWVVTASTNPETGAVSSGSRTIKIPADRAEATQHLLEDVRAIVPPGSAVFVGTDQMGRTSFNSFPIYYLLSEDYEFNSYYLELAAGVAERDDSGLSEDIRAADALILAEFDPEVGDRLFPFAPRGFTVNERTVRENFEKVSTSGRLMLYVRRP